MKDTIRNIPFQSNSTALDTDTLRNQENTTKPSVCMGEEEF